MNWTHGVDVGARRSCTRLEQMYGVKCTENEFNLAIVPEWHRKIIQSI